METEKLSIVATFDDLRRCEAVLTDGTAEIEFLRFAQLQEHCRLQWLSAVQEAQRIQRELDESLRNVSGLETKLYHARKFLEAETKKRKETERERNNLEKKIRQAHELLYAQGNINEETRTKFAFLGGDDRYTSNRRSRRHSDAYGNEINSTGSILSELSVTQSEDDFLDEVHLQTGRIRKHQASMVDDPNASFIGKKRSRLSVDGKPRRSGVNAKSNTQSQQMIEIGHTDKIVASTRVSIPKGSGPITAESVIESIPEPDAFHSPDRCPMNNNNNNNNNNNRRTSNTLKRTFSPTAPTLHECDDESTTALSSPVHKQAHKHQQQPHPNIQMYTATPTLSTSWKHSFSSRTFLKSEMCVHCQKKIKFGTSSLKCRNCRIFVHQDCEPRLNIICMPPSATAPSTPKGAMGCISDYAPNSAPMVPSLIVHCVNEIESRGLNEVGIYRVSGSEKDIRSLKERFLRNKGVPSLQNVDVHVLCGCVKDFLRNLREPLIPTAQWCDFSNASQNACESSAQQELYRAVANMPAANRDTMAFLMQHFLRIASVEAVKMPVSNLAKVFGPTIVGYSSADPDQHAIFTETIIQASVMEKLLSVPGDYWNRYLNVTPFASSSAVSTSSQQRYVQTESDSVQYFTRFTANDTIVASSRFSIQQGLDDNSARLDTASYASLHILPENAAAAAVAATRSTTKRISNALRKIFFMDMRSAAAVAGRKQSFAGYSEPQRCFDCQRSIKYGTKCQRCPPTTLRGNYIKRFSDCNHISDFAPSIAPRVPFIIVHCVNEIEKRAANEVGLYRVCGSLKEIRALKKRYLRSKIVPQLHAIDVHVLCGCVKDFLRYLHEPLIPTAMWHIFSMATTQPNGNHLMYQAVANLPPANRDTLAFLMQHFLFIADIDAVQMPLSNLAKVFGPTIVGFSRADLEQREFFTETVVQTCVMQKMLSLSVRYWQRFLNLEPKVPALPQRPQQYRRQSARNNRI